MSCRSQSGPSHLRGQRGRDQGEQQGFSSTLRHVNRVRKINLSSINEVVTQPGVHLEHIRTDVQVVDVFTKALQPLKWESVLKLLRIMAVARRQQWAHWLLPPAHIATSHAFVAVVEMALRHY